MRYAIRAAALAAAVGIFLIGSMGTARADDAAWKATHDTDPHLPLTAEQLEMTAEKRAAEPQDADPVLEAAPSPDVVCGSCGGSGGYPTSAHLAANQTPQTTSYYCGPASVHEALGSVGVSLSQASAAAKLHTTTAGTAWSGGGTSPSGYPVPDVLNGMQKRNYYVPQPVSSATSSSISTYKRDLEVDIYSVRAPLVGDAWEAPGGPHLVGHPTSREIFHWFEIRGFQNSGGSTMYEDSVHRASSISWSGSVPAYSTMASSTIVTIVAGRGYVW
jgi:hypothetical protein